MSSRSTLGSLSERNYRLFFSGQLVSITGSWLQATAQAWLVLHELKAGGAALGLLAGFTFAPVLLFGLWAGVLADRLDRRRTIIVVDSWMALVAAVQAVLVLTGVVRLWMVFALAFAMGLGNAIEMPTRQAFVGELVGPDRLTNAVALNSATFNAGRVLGPAVAGVLVSVVGTGWCFAVNSLSFFAVIVGLLLMRADELHPVARSATRPRLREGLTYAWNTPVLRTVLMVVAIVGTLTLNWTVVLPLLATEVFDGGPRLLGLFSTSLGLGSLIGSLLAARRPTPTRRMLIVSAVVLGVAELAMAASPHAIVALAFGLVTGYGFMTLMITCNTTLQLSSDPTQRGRVMALYTFLFAGTTPFGAPLVGWIGEHIGPRSAAGVGGIAALVAAALVPVSERAAAKRTAGVTVINGPVVAE